MEMINILIANPKTGVIGPAKVIKATKEQINLNTEKLDLKDYWYKIHKIELEETIEELEIDLSEIE